ncbi:MAG: hypothetical protein P1V51_23150 [Deltaproteobacteria bacterium]|nr:hypothetical protein [Deltaproteobacteria bacterium]
MATRGLHCLLFVLCCAPLPAWSQDTEADVRVSEGVRLYESAELPEAKAVLSRALEDEALPPADASRARKYLAAALLAGGDLAGARAVLVELFQADLEAEVSPGVFVPALVTLAEEARREVEADLAARPAPPVEVPAPPVEPGPVETKEPADPAPPANTGGAATPAPAPADPATPKVRGLSLRAGVFGLSELTGPSLGAGAAVVVGYAGVELSPRLLLGAHLGGEIELAYAFLSGDLQPRLGVRATFVPDAGWGGGQFVGLRLALTGGLELSADAGVAFFDASEDFRRFGILFNLGLAYRVVGR